MGELVLHRDRAEPVLAQEPDHGGIQDKLHILRPLHPVHQGGRRPKLVPAMDEIHLAAQGGKIQRVRHGGVAAAHDGHLLAPIEGPVAGGAIGDARPHEPILVGMAQLPGSGAHAQDHRVGGIGFAVHGEGLLLCRQLKISDGPVDHRQIELSGVLLQGRRQSVPVGAAGHARIVLHPMGLHDLAAGKELLEELHVGPAPGGIDACRQARRTAADDGNA